MSTAGTVMRGTMAEAPMQKRHADVVCYDHPHEIYNFCRMYLHQ
jgi:hypothetical protein